eukprot:GHVU01127835.1.p2 GENE.GHVU01127835.1~~GHVU01127835.1.p2  ORF type:complete len:105 (-),score=1.91 GHVU01127835.1:143-457(-)
MYVHVCVWCRCGHMHCQGCLATETITFLSKVLAYLALEPSAIAIGKHHHRYPNDKGTSAADNGDPPVFPRLGADGQIGGCRDYSPLAAARTSTLIHVYSRQKCY